MDKENPVFSLSYTNLKEMPFDKYDKNFTFIVNDQRYETSRYLADLLSPIIRKFHYTDETINSITIQSYQRNLTSGKEDDYFSDFLKLAEFSPKTISKAQRLHYIEYFIQLGNIEEYLRLQPEINEDQEDTNDVIDRLIFLIESVKNIERQGNLNDVEIGRIINNHNIQKMIRYASSHFSEISKEKIKQLPIEIIEEILNEETLRIEDEDSLLNFIIELYSEDDKYSILFEYVKLSNVSDEFLRKFIDAFNIEDINSGIWKAICSRLLPSSQAPVPSERYLERFREIKHDANNEFHGIMRQLTDETNGNIHDNGTIEITSNSINGSSYHPKNLVDYQNDNYYHSKNEENVTICFDFKERAIQLASYSIKSYNGGQNYGHLRNWVVEVSNDKNSWTVVDKHEDDSTLRGNNIIANFITKETDEFYQFVRLRQTGNSWDNNFYTYFYFIEFYGKLKEKTKLKSAK